MNISSNEKVNRGIPVPITSFNYRDICAPAGPSAREARQAEAAAAKESQQPAAPGPTAQEIGDLVNQARAEAVAETERRLRGEYEARRAAEAAKIREALDLFQS